MAASFRSAGTWSFTANNVSASPTLSPGAPASVAKGDCLILVSESRSNSATATTPSGWLLLKDFPKRSGTASGGTIYVWVRTADGTGSDTPSVSWSGLTSGTSGDSTGAGILCYIGLSTNYDGTGVVQSTDDSADTTTTTIPAFTTVVAGSMVIGIALKLLESSGQTSTVATFTERVDQSTTSGTGHIVEVSDILKSTAGSSGTAAVTWSITTSARALAVSFALKDATVPPPEDPATTPEDQDQWNLAWQTTWNAQRSPTFAPLTLVYGKEPPRQVHQAAPLKAQYNAAWQVMWPAQEGADIAPIAGVVAAYTSWTRSGGGSGAHLDDGTSFTSVSATCSAPVSVGDLIAVAATYSTRSINDDVVTDDLGNTYTRVSGATLDYRGQIIDIWYSVVTHAGTPTVTLEWNPTPGTTTAQYPAVAVDTFTGSDASSTLDGTGSSNGQALPTTTTDAVTSGAFSTSVGTVQGTWTATVNDDHETVAVAFTPGAANTTGSLVYSATQDYATGLGSANHGTGFTDGTNTGSTGNVYLLTEYKVQAFGPPPAVPFSDFRDYRIDHTLVGGSNLTNFVFPFYVPPNTIPALKSTGNGGAVTSTSGFDIGFTALDGTTWSYELRKYDPATGEYLAWVQAPSISHTADTYYQLGWGNAAVTTDRSTAATWSAFGSALVAHLDEASGTVKDSSGTLSNGTAQGSPTYGSTGAVGTGVTFTGASNQGFDFGDVTTFDGLTSLRLSAWVNPATLAVSQRIISKFDNASLANCSFIITTDDSSAHDIEVGIEESDGTGDFFHTTGAPLATGTLVKIDAVWVQGARYEIYVNGVAATSALIGSALMSGGIGNSTDHLLIGAALAGGGAGAGVAWNGLIDEVRVDPVARSADWILAEYNSQSSPSTFSVPVVWTAQDRFIDFTKVGGSDLTNFVFPVYIPPNTLPSLKSTGNGGLVTSTSGFDIIFTGPDGFALWNFELQKYDPATGELLAWVQAPLVSHTANTYYKMLWGNAGITTNQSTTETWSNGYGLVAHMDEASGSINDSTSNAAVGTATGTPTYGVAAQIGTGITFGGSDEFDFGDLTTWDGSTTIRIGAWVKANAIAADARIVLKWEDLAIANHNSFLLSGDSTGGEIVGAFDDTHGTTGQDAWVTTSSALPDATWKKIDIVWVSGATRQTFVNGVSQSVSAFGSFLSSTGLLNTPTHVQIGGESGSSDPTVHGWTGTINEVRIDTTDRSADWLLAEYNSQNSPTTFSMAVSSQVPGAQSATSAAEYSLVWVLAWGALPSLKATIAPLTLVYGDQPPRRVFDEARVKTQQSEAWAVDWPAQRSPQIAPFTLTYGQQPTPLSQLASEFAQQVLSWPPPWPAQRGANIVPLTLTYGNPPPTVDADKTPDQQGRWYLAWQTTWNAQRSATVVPLTLTYGDQPPRSGPLGGSDNAANWAAIGALAPTWGAQSAAPNVAWNTTVSVVPPTVSPSLLDQYVLAWQTSWTAPEPVEVTPLSFTYGDQPAPTPPASPDEQARSVAAWTVTWGAQRGASIAPLTFTYGQTPQDPDATPAQQNGYNLAWQVAWGAQRSATIVPLTLTQGDQPQPTSQLPSLFAQSNLTWQVTWAAQHGATIAPLTLTYGQTPQDPDATPAQQNYYNLAWQTSWGAQRGAQIVPLTLAYGDQPAPTPPADPDAQARSFVAWSVDWAAQRGATIAPLTLSYGQTPQDPDATPAQQNAYNLAWQTTWGAQHGAQIVPLTLTYGQQPTPTSQLPSVFAQSALAWQTTWNAQRGASIAPFTLTYGQQPTPTSQLASEFAQSNLAWQVTWNAQRGAQIAPLTLVYGQTPQDPDATPAQQNYHNLAWQVSWGAQRGATIVPLTLTYGDQPAPTPPADPDAQARAVAAWTVDWTAQRGASIAPLTFTYGQTPQDPDATPAQQNAYNLAWQVTWGAQGSPSIVPLTLAYGDQPPQAPPVTSVDTTILGSWSTAWGAQSAAPNAAWNTVAVVPTAVSPSLLSQYTLAWATTWTAQRSATIVPLTFTYGDQPAPIAPLSSTDALAIASWVTTWGAQSAAPVAGFTVPPAFTPPPVSPSVLDQYVLAWQTSWTAPEPVEVTPLSLTYGDQPAPTPPADPDALTRSVLAWTVDWPAQRGASIAPLTFTYGQTPQDPDATPAQQNQYNLSWQVTWGAQRGAAIVPLTLSYGQQPQPVSQIASVVAQSNLAWQTTWGAQHGASVAPLTLAYGQTPQDPDATPAQQNAYNLAWQVTWSAQRGATIVPLTFTYGDFPQSPAADAAQQNQYALAWQTSWGAQRGAQVAPLTLVYGQTPQDPDATPAQQAQWNLAWQTTWGAQGSPTIVPLTLTYGSQPQPTVQVASVLAQANLAWQTTWGAQRSATIVPLTFTYGDAPQPTSQIASAFAQSNLAWQVTWSAQSEPDNAGWNIFYGFAPATISPQAVSAYALVWQTTWAAQRGASIVPLTLTYGKQPPAPVSPQTLSASALAWQTTWSAQHGAQIVPLTFKYGQQPQDPNATPDAKVAYAAAWQVTWSAQHGATIAPLTLSYGDFPQDPDATPAQQTQWNLAWQTSWSAQRGAQVVPLTLAYGQQPTPQPPADPDAQARAAVAWQVTWGAQHAPTNANAASPVSAGTGSSVAPSIVTAAATAIHARSPNAVSGAVVCGVGVAIVSRSPSISAPSIDRASGASIAAGTGRSTAESVASAPATLTEPGQGVSTAGTTVVGVGVAIHGRAPSIVASAIVDGSGTAVVGGTGRSTGESPTVAAGRSTASGVGTSNASSIVVGAPSAPKPHHVVATLAVFPRTAGTLETAPRMSATAMATPRSEVLDPMAEPRVEATLMAAPRLSASIIVNGG